MLEPYASRGARTDLRGGFARKGLVFTRSEWYFYPTFQLLRTVPNKLLGVLLMAAVPAGLLVVPFIENINKFQNPFRRPVATTVFLIGTVAAIWLGIGATLPIDISLTLGLF